MPLSPPSRLLAVADQETLGGALLEKVSAARRGGVSWFLLRAKTLSENEAAALAEKVLEAADGAFVSVNGPGCAMLSRRGFGVHYPSDRVPASPRYPGCLEGVSCHTAVELEAAARAGFSYALLSPVYPTLSKASTGNELGPESFGALVRGAGMPVYALGGVTPEKIVEIAVRGGHGVAALGGLFLSEDIENEAARWVKAVEEAYKEP